MDHGGYVFTMPHLFNNNIVLFCHPTKAATTTISLFLNRCSLVKQNKFVTLTHDINTFSQGCQMARLITICLANCGIIVIFQGCAHHAAV